jgi:hypothetical protein
MQNAIALEKNEKRKKETNAIALEPFCAYSSLPDELAIFF